MGDGGGGNGNNGGPLGDVLGGFLGLFNGKDTNSPSQADINTAGQQTAGNLAARMGVGHAGSIGQGKAPGNPTGSTADPSSQAVGATMAGKISNSLGGRSFVRGALSALSKSQLGMDLTSLSPPDNAFQVGQDVAAGWGKGWGKGFNNGQGGGMVAGEKGNFDTPSEGGINQLIQSKADTTLNQSPPPAEDPEEPAEDPVEEERKAARRRIGLMQMRAVDPLFIENLPQIFRSRAY